MRVDKLTLREIHLELIEPFQTSFDTSKERRILLIEANVDGVTGWGESTAGEDPFYSYETVETACHIIRDFIWPTLRGREFASASEIWDSLARIRGHNMAKGGARNRPLGCRSQAEKRPACEAAWRHARRNSLRRFHWHSALDRRPYRESRTRTRRRLPAHQNQDQARPGGRARAGLARTFSRAFA